MGRDDHVLAVGVIGCTSCNRNPHITELRLKFGDLKLSGFNPALLCFQIFESRCQEEAVSSLLWDGSFLLVFTIPVPKIAIREVPFMFRISPEF